MTPSDSLFDLIHSLTPPEKRFFKIYASRHTPAGHNNYVALFDVIAQQKKYAEPAVKAHFQGQALVQNLPSAKNYLTKLILRSMRMFHQEKNIDSQLRALRSDLEFLKDKKLHGLFDKLFKKAKNLAATHEKHTVLLDLMELERFRFKEKTRKRLVEGAKAISKEMHDIIDRKKMEVEYTCLLDSLYILLRKGAGSHEVSPEIQIEEMMASPLLQGPQKANSFVSRMYFHQTNAIGYQMQGRNKFAAQHYSAVIENWRAHPLQIKSLPRLYRKSLANYLASLHLIEEYSLFPSVLTQIRDSVAKTPLDRADVFRLSTFYQLIYYLGTGDFNAATLLSYDIEQGLGQHKKWIDPAWKIVICYNIANAHFFQNEFQKAQIWLNQVVNIEQTEQRKDVQAAAKLLMLAVHLERGNLDLLESSLNALKYQIGKEVPMDKPERIAWKYFSRALRLPPKQLKSEFFAPFHQQLQALADSRKAAVRIGVTELITWSKRT